MNRQDQLLICYMALSATITFETPQAVSNSFHYAIFVALAKQAKRPILSYCTIQINLMFY